MVWLWILIGVLCVLLISVACSSCKAVKIEEFGHSDVTDDYNLPFIVNGLLTNEERTELMQFCIPRLHDSATIGGKNAAVRNSQQCWVPHTNPIVTRLLSDLHQRFGMDPRQAEDLQVVRYKPGQYYKEHHDACCEGGDVCTDFNSKGGHRILTVLIYLNNEFEGGATRFKNLEIDVKPDPGDAVVFFPLAKDQKKCHPYALHAGLPVTAGEKWVCNLWYREQQIK